MVPFRAVFKVKLLATFAAVLAALAMAGLLLATLAGAEGAPPAESRDPSKLDAVLAGLLAGHEGRVTILSGDDHVYGVPFSSPAKEGVFPLQVDEDGTALVDALVKTSAPLDGLEGLGVIVQASVGSVLAVRIPLDSLAAFITLPGVEFVEGSRMAYPLNDAGVPATGAPAFRSATGQDGTGVVLGTLDTGVDFTHPDFQNPDGTTRIKFLCDQSDPPQGGDNTCPAHDGPNAGTLWTEAQINAALAGGPPVRQTDSDGHGTHVLGSAAGNDLTFGGMAPGAHLVVVNGGSGFSSIEEIAAIEFIDARAADLGMPYVINMSLGGHIGPHDGTDLASTAISEVFGAGKPGKAIVVAAGNEGGDNLHAGGSVVPGPQTITFQVPADTEVVFIDAWYDGDDTFSVGFLDPNGNGIPEIVPGNPFTTCPPGVNTCVHVSHVGPQAGNGDIEVFMVLFPPDGVETIGLPGTWILTFTGHVVNVGTFDAWIHCVGTFCEFDGGDNEKSVGEPGVAADAITVGSYTTKSNWLSTDGSIYSYNPPPTAGEISSFSSRGPTRDSRQKPDITAPGEVVVSSWSIDAPPEIIPFIAPGEEHIVKQGTSMATPHVSGAVALLLAEDPTLDAAQIKALLQDHAVLDGFTSGVCDNTWGCGKLNIASISFVLAAPTPLSPLNGSRTNGDTPLFVWEAAPGSPDSYTLEVVTAGSGFQAPFAQRETGITAIQFQTSEPGFDDGAYDWRVITVKGAETAGSSAFTFTVDTTGPDAPVLVFPGEGEAIAEPAPLLDWDHPDTGDVLDYILRVTSGHIIAGDVVIDDLIIEGSSPAPTSFQIDPQSPLADGAYQWRVTARDVLLNPTDSAVGNFTVDTFVADAILVFPPADGVIGDPQPTLPMDTSRRPRVTGFVRPTGQIWRPGRHRRGDVRHKLYAHRTPADLGRRIGQ